jgi:Domain of unknown function (DUF397)
MNWRRSSFSMSNGHCVEVALRGGRVLVRDSKDPDGPVLSFSQAEWAGFLTDVKRYECYASS